MGRPEGRTHWSQNAMQDASCNSVPLAQPDRMGILIDPYMLGQDFLVSVGFLGYTLTFPSGSEALVFFDTYALRGSGTTNDGWHCNNTHINMALRGLLFRLFPERPISFFFS